MAKDLEELRKSIDEIDDQIISLLVKRFELSVQAVEFKIKKQGLNKKAVKSFLKKLIDHKRERELKKRLKNKKIFENRFINRLYNIILKESHRQQKRFLVKLKQTLK